MPRQMTGPWVSMIDMPAQLTPEQQMMLLAQNDQAPDPNMIYTGAPAANAPSMTPPAPAAPAFPGGGGPEPLSKSAYDDLVARLNDKGIQSLALQTQGIKTLEGQRDALAAMPQQLDLSPISNLIDQWTGQDLTGAYKRPMSAQEKTQMLMGIESGIQKAREGLSGNEIELLKGQLGIEASKEAAAERREDRKLSRDALNANRTALADERKTQRALQARENLIKTKQAEQMDGATAFTSALNTYEQKVKQYGINPTGKAADDLNAAYADVTTSYKEAKKLGALSGPDMGIVHGAVGPAGEFGSYLKSKAKGGKEGLLSAINIVRNASKKDFNRNYDVLKKTYGDVADDVLGSYKQQFDSVSTGAGAPAATTTTYQPNQVVEIRGVKYKILDAAGNLEKVQ